MTKADELRRTLSQLESGECRFVVERWIHVYCHAPCVEWEQPLQVFKVVVKVAVD